MQQEQRSTLAESRANDVARTFKVRLAESYTHELTPGRVCAQDLVIFATNHGTADYNALVLNERAVLVTRGVNRKECVVDRKVHLL